MVLTLALASNIEYVRGRINGEAVTFEQDLAGSWVTNVDQSSDNRYELDLEMEDAAGNIGTYHETIVYVLPRFITDRTQEDIEQRTSKGFLNATDLERVESNTELIAGYLAIPVTVKKGWKTGDLPRISDFQRIRDNVEKIRSGYVIRADTPVTPVQPLNTWQKWNDLEQILYDVFWIYFNNLNNKDYCGEISAGEEIGVI
nr:MAG TPA: hypothetical protein [Caudoviricetes sp.]